MDYSSNQEPYIAVCKSDKKEFNKECSDLMKKGYRPYGNITIGNVGGSTKGLSVNDFYFIQSFILPMNITSQEESPAYKDYGPTRSIK